MTTKLASNPIKPIKSDPPKGEILGILKIFNIPKTAKRERTGKYNKKPTNNTRSRAGGKIKEIKGRIGRIKNIAIIFIFGSKNFTTFPILFNQVKAFLF
ncbi:MAG TPA: hypothetical protein PLK71_00470 [Candidatus Paceibacterota bacterium]|jgi:hypothetical protein|nr:hypothetical protein [Candidatus Paceibacterota bacterium]HPI24619.1 hypothetical protein [Candidatus Paceibacterota bacterium]HPN89682.1 hypothetical protein [Candidatus Paceibacterota bacterium]HPV33476.1 hypothetical protein [Candidatus Paceibacterota bacterium]HQB26970.1 hypothetical protein [Candidatus Paceibacterota bacterium]